MLDAQGRFGIFRPFDGVGGPIQQSVLPLVALANGTAHALGTGFILNPDGLLVTAKHVLKELERIGRKHCGERWNDHVIPCALYIKAQANTEDDKCLFGGPIVISKMWLPNDIDIAFCWLDVPTDTRTNKKIPLHPVIVRPRPPSVGDVVIAAGYYRMASEYVNEDEAGGAVMHQQETATSSGKVIEVYPQFRDRSMMTFPSFRTDARFDCGMSGGPIFHGDGSVCGVVCSSIKWDKESDGYVSFGSLIWPIFGYGIEIALGEGLPVQSILLADLASRGLISTDRSIDDLTITRHPNGTTTVSYIPPNT